MGSSGLADCRIDVFDDVRAAEPAWRQLQDEGSLATAYQDVAWASAWQHHAGSATGVVPYIVLGTDGLGRPLFLWPFGRRQAGPLQLVQFLGGKHANLNLAVWRRDVAAAANKADLRSVLGRLRRSGPRADLFLLQNQPLSWDGIANPFALLAHQPSPSPAFRGALQGDYDEVLRTRIGSETRRKLRQKERALARHGTLAFWRAETPDRQARVLDAFFAQKALRMAELGLADVFAEPGVRDFIAAAAIGPRPTIELYAACLDDTILATFGGIASATRLSGMFNSMIQGGLAAESPGEILLSHVVRMACERGLTTFDLGVGDAGYKRGFCNEEEPLFDSVLGLTVAGRAVAPLWRFRLASKGAIKRSAVWQLVAAAKRRRGKAAKGDEKAGAKG